MHLFGGRRFATTPSYWRLRRSLSNTRVAASTAAVAGVGSIQLRIMNHLPRKPESFEMLIHPVCPACYREMYDYDAMDEVWRCFQCGYNSVDGLEASGHDSLYATPFEDDSVVD